MMLAFVTLNAVLLASAHSCIHDKLMAHDSRDASHELAKRDVKAVTLGPYAPLRIKIDESFLSKSDGVCQQEGAWAKLGRPSGSEAQRTPLCAVGCEVLGCNCWFKCEQNDILYQEKKDHLVKKIFPKAVEILSSALSVRRTTLNLNQLRDGNCACANSFVNVTALANGYSNYNEHDLVLFVTARVNRFFTGDTLAFACACYSNIIGRAVFGQINWGADKIDFQDPIKFNQQVGVAVHEITHALGFSKSRFEDFLDESKLPTNSMLPDNFMYPRIAKSQVLSMTSGSPPKTVIVTPNAVRVAREHFNCSTITGVEVEDDGSEATVGSHWEKRIFENEYMTGSSSYDPRYSRFTFALLQDSGWYQVNYSAVGTFEFGKNEGCDFVRPHCDKFTGPYRCLPSEKGYWGCTFDRKERGICNVNQYMTPIPENLRPFPDNITWGGDQLSDFCPLYKYSSNLQSDCTVPAYQNAAALLRGEVFSASSRCLESTLLINNRQGLKGNGGCYALMCYLNVLQVRVLNRFYACKTPGLEIKIDGYNGVLKCPSTAVAKQLCDAAPAVSTWPTITKVTPSSGPPITTNTVLEVTGTELKTISKMIVGDYECTNIVKVGDTVASCRFGARSMTTPAPTSGDSLIDKFTDLFTVSDDEKRNAQDVYIVLTDGRTASLDDGYAESTSSAGVASLQFALVALACWLCLA